MIFAFFYLLREYNISLLFQPIYEKMVSLGRLIVTKIFVDSF